MSDDIAVIKAKCAELKPIYGDVAARFITDGLIRRFKTGGIVIVHPDSVFAMIGNDQFTIKDGKILKGGVELPPGNEYAQLMQGGNKKTRGNKKKRRPTRKRRYSARKRR